MRTQRDRRWAAGTWAGICLVLLATTVPAAALDQTLVATGSSWRYRDAGLSPGAGWTIAAYDDGGWASGPAQLGYGDGDEATVVSYGGNASAKAITTYFRRTFTVTGAVAFQRLQTRLLVDDGAVVYLNGVELRRDNLPAGAIGAGTLATVAKGGAAESAFVSASTGATALVEGTNVVAVEVHQASATSTDVSFDLELVGSTSGAVVTRGPYLQLGTSSGIVVRWRTDTPTDSRVSYGLQHDALSQVAGAAALVTEHVVTLSGLSPGTTYYYAVGTSGGPLAGGDEAHRFRTLVTPGTAVATRIWAVGDSGTGGAGARSVRDAYLDFVAGAPPDLWMMLGDNAYFSGTDAEYQTGLFDVYQSLLTTSVLWPTLGNHDGASADSATQTGPYYDNFSLPAAAQAGGVASGTEAYYSFDVGRTHIVCLESYETSRATNGPMLTWLAADLAAASQADWAIAFWHHPPYSKGSHDSDVETELVQMRQNALPVLEAGGIDLVLTGHSHAYERSWLLDGHYGVSTTLQAAMVRDAGDGRVEGDGAYAKPAGGLSAHGGAVYVVAGSGAQTSGGALDHPAMAVSRNALGAVLLDVVGQTLSVRMLDDTGGLRDAFTITKGAVATHAASGAITYYHGGGAVPDVALTASQHSDPNGAFAVAVPHGAPVALRPSRSGGTGGAVSALDAAWVLQTVAGLRALDATQRLACDASGDGTLSALDASYILARVVDPTDHLPVADQCGSDFAFQPSVAPPIAGRALSHHAAGGVCQSGAIELEPLLAATAGLDFRAAAFGDCTGNWNAAAAQVRRGRGARLHLGRLRHAGSAWRLPLSVAGDRFSAVELALDLGPGQTVRHVRKLGAGRDALVRVGPGGRRIAVASARPLGELRLEIRGDGPASAGVPVRVTAARVDEDPADIR